MTEEAIRRARDLHLLDAIDALERVMIDAEVWRIVREGRDPVQGTPSRGRWSNGTFDVLYTSFERDGAIAEIHALLALQPVFPSKDRCFVHKLRVSAASALKLADLAALDALGVDIGRYGERESGRTQEIADAAYFLGFDGLVVPSARWTCSNLVFFTDRIAPERIEIVGHDELVAWDQWRRAQRR